MAGVTPWVWLTIALVPPLTVPVVVALAGTVNARLAALQMAGALAAFLLAAMTFATDQSSFIDLALCLSLLSVPGTLLTALFMERWL